jgi:hypothetical protein
MFDEDVEWARWAVARWEAFPVDRVPRPLVVLGETAHARNGFRSQRAKRAFHNGWIEPRVSVPDAVLETLGQQSGRPEREPAIVITAAERCAVEQRTDRGPRWLPGWELRSDQTLGPIVVLDPEVIAEAWAPPEPGPPPPAVAEPGHAPVRGEADGRSLTYRFMGALPNYEHYPSAEVIESPQAVAVVPQAEDIGPPGARIAPGFGHRITVTLEEPLGARVLVDLHGNAGEVTVL